MLRRVVPDPVQVQVILGSLLGDGRLEGTEGDRRLHIAHHRDRASTSGGSTNARCVRGARTSARGDRLEFRTIAHPVFDDLAPLFAGSDRRRARELLAPLGLAVWMTDVGRLRLRGRSVPTDAASRCAGCELGRDRLRDALRCGGDVSRGDPRWCDPRSDGWRFHGELVTQALDRAAVQLAGAGFADAILARLAQRQFMAVTARDDLTLASR